MLPYLICLERETRWKVFFSRFLPSPTIHAIMESDFTSERHWSCLHKSWAFVSLPPPSPSVIKTIFCLLLMPSYRKQAAHERRADEGLFGFKLILHQRIEMGGWRRMCPDANWRAEKHSLMSWVVGSMGRGKVFVTFAPIEGQTALINFTAVTAKFIQSAVIYRAALMKALHLTNARICAFFSALAPHTTLK